MKPFLYVAFLLAVLSCRQNDLTPAAAPVGAPISDFSVDGIGPVAISPDNSINVTLPAGFQADSIRIRYRLAPNISLPTGPGAIPSGSVIYFKGIYPPLIDLCGGNVNCDKLYTIHVRYADALKFTPVDRSAFTTDNDKMQFNLKFYIQNYGTVESMASLFRLRFTNQNTGYVYEMPSISIREGVNRSFRVANSAPWAVLNIEGPMYFDMASQPGSYKIEVIYETNGQTYAVAERLILKKGRPIVVSVPSATEANRLDVQALNLAPTTVSSLRFDNDFVPSQTVRGEFMSATQTRFNVATTTPPGVYIANVSVSSDTPRPRLLAVPSATARSYLNVAAPLGTLSAYFSSFDELPALRPGTSLALNFAFVSAEGPGEFYPTNSDYRGSEVALTRLDDPTQRYALIPGERVEIFLNNQWQYAWKETIPTSVPKGDYKLTFKDVYGATSLPHFRKITVL